MITFSDKAKNLGRTETDEDQNQSSLKTTNSSMMTETETKNNQTTTSLKDSPKEKFISVELYKIEDEETLRNLDSLEGHPRWYVRTPVKTLSGEIIQVYDMPKERHAYSTQTEEYLRDQFTHETDQ